MKFCRCSRKYFCFCLLLTLSFIFYVEFFSYFINTYKWRQPKCDRPKDCTRILLIADPQVIGQRNEPLHLLTPLSIFDSDLYLAKTYYWAFNFARPDIVIFLGDLMDEGSIANSEEFYSYVRRIFNIFLDHSTSSVKHIWLPGDNDIGGEHYDRITEEKLKRFHRAFAQPDLIVHKNITFFKINRLTESIPVFKGKREFHDTSRIVIGLSHMPLMFMPSLFVEKVFNKMLPHVLFTAHEHKPMIVSMDALVRQDRHISSVTSDANKIYEFLLGTIDMYEFIIPTCSYRMGTDKIGYGLAVLERNELRFTVLWSPPRFHQLGSYLVFAFFVLLCLWCCRWSVRRVV